LLGWLARARRELAELQQSLKEGRFCYVPFWAAPGAEGAEAVPLVPERLLPSEAFVKHLLHVVPAR
jgi:hypothetical protein